MGHGACLLAGLHVCCWAMSCGAHILAPSTAKPATCTSPSQLLGNGTCYIPLVPDLAQGTGGTLLKPYKPMPALRLVVAFLLLKRT